MSRRTTTMQAEYFDTLYAGDIDPWRFRTSDYERDKYRATLAMLARQSYGAALEVGCSIGVFTSLLAPRCEHLVAIDPSATALDAARESVGEARVEFRLGMLPRDMPEGRFDLIVMSEVLYYLDRLDAARAVDACCDHLAPGGEIVFCHFLGETDYPLKGDDAAELALEVASRHGLQGRTERHTGYRLDQLRAAQA